MPTVRNKDIGSWNLSLKEMNEMNETSNERYSSYYSKQLQLLAPEVHVAF